ncbi:1-acyl-sn-glycerol-3-phosphate acyltransferase, partial [Streptomyces sp. 2MCAF27]
VDLSAYYGKEPTAEVLRAATDDIMAAVAELLSEVRGEPAPTERYEYRSGTSHAAGEPPAADEESK